MRGRLINRFVCVLVRLDAAATAVVAGGGYDADFRAVKPVADGSQLGASSRRERAAVRIPCQLDRSTWGADQLRRSGHRTDSDIVITLHWPDLERLGLIASDGRPDIRQGDRIAAIETDAGATEESFPNPPGMFVHDLERAGHGLAPFGGARTNLLNLYCNFGEVSGA